MHLFGFDVTRTKTLQTVAENRGGWRSIVREAFAGAWQRNVEWTVDSVLAHHAVYSCITLIASDIGKLRPKLVEQDANGIWSEVTSPAFSPVLRKPNRFQNHIQFKEWWITSKLTYGNAYALKQRDQRGIVTALYLLDPSRVQVLVSSDGAVFYQLAQDNLSGITETRAVAVPSSEIIHDRMNCLFHPLIGVSPIFASGAAANVGLQIQGNSATFFGNGSLMSGILSSVADIPAKKAEELTTLWNARFGPNGEGGVAILGSGMKYEPMRMTATDSQLIDQLKWSAETVASAFHVPAFKIGVGAMPTYSNGEVLDQRYYSDCLQSHIESFELCMDEGLGLNEAKEGKVMGVELDLDGLLRMDTATQVETLTKGIRGGLYTPNGARRKIDEKPLKGGDTIYLQHQDYPMEMVFERTDLNPKAAPTAPPLPSPPVKEDDADTESRSLEKWDGWFARDSLTLVREAKALELGVVQKALAATRHSQVESAISEIGTAVSVLARRENPAPVVNVSPPAVHVAAPVVNITPQEKTVTKHSRVVRDENGSIVGVDTTETRK